MNSKIAVASIAAILGSLFVGGFMPTAGADIYGMGELSIQMIYGGRALGHGVGFALISFPLTYRLIYQAKLQHLKFSALLGLFVIAASLMGPPLRYLLEFSGQPLLALIPVVLGPAIVLQVASYLIAPTSSAFIGGDASSRQPLPTPSNPCFTTVDHVVLTPALVPNARLPAKSALKPSESVVISQGFPTSPESQISEFDQNAIYGSIAKEIESGSTDKGLWTRLYAECDGDDKRTKVQYIKRRAAQLMEVERARQAAEMDTVKGAADREAVEIASSQQRIVEDRAKSEKTAMEERLRQPLSEGELKKKEWDALSRFPIEKVGNYYRYNGTNYYHLDDAIRQVNQLASGNPWESLAYKDDSETKNSSVVIVFAALGVVIALVYIATQYYGSKSSNDESTASYDSSPSTFNDLPLMFSSDFLNIPAVDAKVKSALGPNYGRFKKTIGVASPVILEDGFRYFGTGCEPHMCGVSEGAFTLDKNGRFYGTTFTDKKFPNAFEHFGDGYPSFSHAAWMANLTTKELDFATLPREWGQTKLTYIQDGQRARISIVTGDSSCSGMFEGDGSIQNGILSIKDTNGAACKLAFFIDSSRINVIASPTCEAYHGARCTFSGTQR